MVLHLHVEGAGAADDVAVEVVVEARHLGAIQGHRVDRRSIGDNAGANLAEGEPQRLRAVAGNVDDLARNFEPVSFHGLYCELERIGDGISTETGKIGQSLNSRAEGGDGVGSRDVCPSHAHTGTAVGGELNIGDGDLSEEPSGDSMQDAAMLKRVDITLALQCGLLFINAARGVDDERKFEVATGVGHSEAITAFVSATGRVRERTMMK